MELEKWTIESISPEHRVPSMDWVLFDQDEAVRNETIQAAQIAQFTGMKLCCGDRKLASAYALTYPGKLGLLHGPRLENDPPAELVQAMMNGLLQRCCESGAALVQAIIDPVESPRSHLLQASGFRKLTTLIQMHRDNSLNLKGNPDRAGSPKWKSKNPVDELLLKKYTECDRAAWIKVLDATYCKTLDCPELNGVRDTGDTLDGYLAGFNEGSQWWMLEQRGEAIGCIMLTELMESVFELTYMGLSLEYRGKGLANLLLQWGLRCIEPTSKKVDLWLAVDWRNTQAMRIYRAWGFRAHRELEAWIWTLN